MFEVGAYEQFEEGFIFLVSLATKAEADFFVERLNYYQEKLPVCVMTCSDQDMDVFVDECDKIDAQLHRELGVGIPISLYIKGLYQFVVIEKKAH